MQIDGDVLQILRPENDYYKLGGVDPMHYADQTVRGVVDQKKSYRSARRFLLS
ncbi:hypothetical protein PAXINDRAFT_167971 [Paxillus involutus ATCC 200175]|jgi:hypothetical protein|nr:hypothetical protein PAXINDRAFT_167971 [Paxillus involutus ATCC 200175]